jgi:hypothetical protein
MRRKMMALLSILVIFTSTQQALAQCNWSTKVVLFAHTNAQPGLTALPDRLVLTWAGTNNGHFNSLISVDGVNWSNHVIRSNFPIIKERYAGGLGMTYSAPCGAGYAGWNDPFGRLWATRTFNGIIWDPPQLIMSPFGEGGATRYAFSAPALRGDDPSLPIGFGVTSTSTIWPDQFQVFKGKFTCDMGNPVFPIQPSFFNRYVFHDGLASTRQREPSTPVWTGAGGMELSVLASGADDFVNIESMYYQYTGIDARTIDFAVNFWSNNGVAGVVNPNNGNSIISWTCHPGNGDTCRPESTGRVNLRNLNTGGGQVCADWSIYNPAMTFYQGKIWLAWRGNESGQTGFINVASINPF